MRLKTTENTFSKDLDVLYWRQTAHFVENFEKVNLEKDPFIHFEAQGLFSNEFYNYMKHILPEGEELLSIVDTKLVPGQYPKERKTLPIKCFHDGFKMMEKYVESADKKNQYARLYKWFRHIMIPSVLKKYNINLRNITHDELLYVHDDLGYALAPHTDVREKIVTILMYLPDDDAISSAGTNLLVPKEKGFTDKFNMKLKEENFNIVKTSKFIPNNIFSFVRSDTSFHSVSKLNLPNPRKLLLYTLANQNVDKE